MTFLPMLDAVSSSALQCHKRHCTALFITRHSSSCLANCNALSRNKVLKERNNKVFYLFTSTISLITVRYPFEWSLRLRFFCMIKVPFDTFVVKFHSYSLLSVVFMETSNYFFIRFSASKRQHSQTPSPDCVHLKILIR